MREQFKSNPDECALQVSPSAIRTLHYARKSKRVGVGMPIYPNTLCSTHLFGLGRA
jgi:hypothetical protein